MTKLDNDLKKQVQCFLDKGVPLSIIIKAFKLSKQQITRGMLGYLNLEKQSAVELFSVFEKVDRFRRLTGYSNIINRIQRLLSLKISSRCGVNIAGIENEINSLSGITYPEYHQLLISIFYYQSTYGKKITLRLIVDESLHEMLKDNKVLSEEELEMRLKTKINLQAMQKKFYINSLSQLDVEVILNSLSILRSREAECLNMYFGLTNNPMTLEQIGKYFGITKECTRQIIVKALRKMKHPSRSSKFLHLIKDDSVT